jgi:hypothetical protein
MATRVRSSVAFSLYGNKFKKAPPSGGVSSFFVAQAEKTDGDGKMYLG